MKRLWTLAAACAALLTPVFATAQAPTAAPNYRQATTWLCRPEAPGACAVDLNAMGVEATGARRPQPFQAATEPAIDCFYVYPTISADDSPLSDLTPGPEEARVVRAQFARLASRCRLFAPVYRQVTMSALATRLRGGGGGAVDFETPYADVLAAWRDYMARDNNGRGVVVIGHSQGAILLTRLLREEVDGQPAQRLLVGAYLAGHPGLAVPEGRDAGGALPTIPVCSRADQAGCVVVWASYLASDTTSPRGFGQMRQPGMTAACVNPAAVGGGSATLRGYFSRPAAAPETDPPFVLNLSGVTGQCVTDADGSVLRVSVTPDTPLAPVLTTALQRAGALPGWGLHAIDVNLVMGDIETSIARQAAAWSSPAQ